MTPGRVFLRLLLLGFLLSPVPASAYLSFEGPPIEYSTRPTNDPIRRLAERIQSGEAALEYDEERGYLPSLLKLLNIPVSSQTLVFSKTSFQAPYITPEKPRAVYFNDDVYIGWVQGGEVVEISAVDPEQGAVFYALSQTPHEPPQFDRQTDACLQCHASPLTDSIPGHLFRSVYVNEIGQPILKAGTFKTTQSSPLSERWGGWYVTGRHGGQVHMGNVRLVGSEIPEELPVEEGANLTRLDQVINVSPYLSPHSDLAALMVLGHQVEFHNLITHANYQARIALAIQEELRGRNGEREGDLSEGTLQRFRYAADRLLKCMLFLDEAPLEGPVRGTSGFAEEFEALGPRDGKGRSLRDLDLRTRTFKHPCSFLIHSESFDSLPKPFLDYLYNRLLEILTAETVPEGFESLSPEDRLAVYEILLDTKEGLPDDWRDGSTVN